MLTLMGIIMEPMAQGKLKNIFDKEKIISFVKEKIHEPLIALSVAMIVLILIIATILIRRIDRYAGEDILSKEEVTEEVYIREEASTDSEASYVSSVETFVPCEDESVNSFIKHYFRYRTYLDFVNIFKAYNKDYITMKDTEEGDAIVNGILYEKNYIRDYENIKVYSHSGLKDNEMLLIVDYEMALHFSRENAPTILVVYIVKDGDNIYIKDKFDVGESKYISTMLKRPEVVALYNIVKNRLERAITNDQDLKLAYNSLRQYDINPNNDILGDLDMWLDKLRGNTSNQEKELMDLARKKEKEDITSIQVD